MSYLGTPEEFEEWLATDQAIPLQEWLVSRSTETQIDKRIRHMVANGYTAGEAAEIGDEYRQRMRKQINQIADSIRMVDEYYGEKATREREQVQRSDDLREALAGTTIELIEDRTQFNRKIDVVRYDDAGNREIVGEAELNMDGNVVVMKAEVDKDKLRDLLQTEVDRFS